MNPDPPRVSVILPCYNGAPYVREAVRSILDQTLSELELIVVDDGSTDASPAILRELAAGDARMRVLTRGNGGIVAALNAALPLVRGRYVARMDADDVSFPDRLAFQARYLDHHPETVLVGGRAVADLRPRPASTRTTGGRHARTDLSVFPPRIAVAMHPLIMIRADVLRAMGGYLATYPHAEDYELFIRASAWGRIDNPPVDMLFYRRHEGAVSIANLEVQERSAVRAELDALARAGLPAPSPRMLEAYLRLRLFRRYRAISPARVRAMRLPVLRDLLAVAPKAVLSRRFRRLPLLIGAALVRSLRSA
ncbi:glycosyltransferase family 2 protein [Novosphingobium soli]|uniref:Glycosyltransferase family 2 protein n=1 Tax=Novosphingobium soli TaxID=574956 RepID=A0ABV6CXZ8_9SPHN